MIKQDVIMGLSMRRESLLKVGIIGSITAALCCFSPVLVIFFGFLGLSVLTGYLDYVLMPVLLFFLALTVYAYFIKKAS